MGLSVCSASRSAQPGGVGVLGGQSGEHDQRRALSDRQIRQAAIERAFADRLATTPATTGPDRARRPAGPASSFHLAAECGHRPGQPDPDDGQGCLDRVPARGAQAPPHEPFAQVAGHLERSQAAEGPSGAPAGPSGHHRRQGGLGQQVRHRCRQRGALERACRGRSCPLARASRTRHRDAAAAARPPSRRPRSRAGRPIRPPAAGYERSAPP